MARKDGFFGAVGEFSRPAAAIVGAVASLACFAIQGCPNTSGKGNEFRVTGTVETVHDRSVRLEIGRVMLARGKAKGKFKEGEEIEVDDNYEACSAWKHRETVGHEVAENGSKESLDDVKPGELVELDGKIRTSYTTCTSKTKLYGSQPVFDTLTELPR